MDNYIFPTIIGAAVIEFINEFLPINAKSSLRKYLRYIISLIIILSIISPIISVVGDDSSDIIKSFSNYDYSKTAHTHTEDYILVTDIAVYEATPSGEKVNDTPVFCDMYITKCTRSIADKSKGELIQKFSLDKNDIKIDIAIDISEYESIEIIRANVGIKGAKNFLINDACDYLSDILSCPVYAIKISEE